MIEKKMREKELVFCVCVRSERARAAQYAHMYVCWMDLDIAIIIRNYI